MSTYMFDRDALLDALENLGNNNAQREYYLTDCPAYLLSKGKKVEAKPVLQDCEALSINTIDELGAVESKMRDMGYHHKLKIFSGRANPQLARDICAFLHLEVGSVSLGKFPDGENFCKIEEHARAGCLFGAANLPASK